MSPTRGVVLQGVDPPEVFEDTARRVEALGYDHLWLTDSSLHARNPYAYLALAARQTSTVSLGTAVTNPLTRHPGVTVAAIATIDDVSGGRAVLGIGPGDRPVEALGFRPARLAELRESIGAVRSLLAGAGVDSDGLHFAFRDARLRFDARDDLPIYVSASGPRMLELAGEVADGVIVLCGLFREGIDYAVSHVEAGAARAGRPRPHVAVMAYGAIDDEDEDRALGAARTIAAWFPQTAPKYCELAGLDPAIVESVRARYQGGEFQEAAPAAEQIPAEFVRRVAVAGSSARVAEQLAAALAAPVDSVQLFPLGERRAETIEAFARCWSEATG